MAEATLQGRIAVVTGGGRGLGRAIVRALGAAGADVALSYRTSRAGAVAEVEALQRQGLRSLALAADARKPGEVAAFVERAAAEWGGIDILVNNAGVFRRTPLDDVDDDMLDEAFAVNVKAAVLAARAAAPHMRRRGGGSIVNVASGGGLRPWPNHVAYCSSKAALIMATRCLALALAPDVRVNAVAPGILGDPADPWPPSVDPAHGPALRSRIPAGRFGTVDETVAAVMFLAAAAPYTTGEVISVDGGRRLA